MKKDIPIIAALQDQLDEICHARQVNRLYLFGSALTEAFDQSKDSDLDFLVSMDAQLLPLERGEHLLQLWTELELLFGRPVDLLTDTSLQNPFLKREIDATKALVYDGASQKILV